MCARLCPDAEAAAGWVRRTDPEARAVLEACFLTQGRISYLMRVLAFQVRGLAGPTEVAC